MKWQLLALLLLFSSAVWAISMPPVLVPYLEPGLNLSATVLNTSLGEATVVSINGQETLMADNWNNEMVNGSDAISSQLKDDVQRSSGFADALATLNSTLSDLQTQQDAAMAVCGQYTGTDHLPCVDKDTCNAAAQASLAQNGIESDGFWEAMRDMVVDRNNVNASLNALAADEANGQVTAGRSQALAADMANVTGQLDILYTNDLFLNQTDPQCVGLNASYCFQFCPKINWSADDSGWNALQGQFTSIAATLDSLSAQDARASALATAEANWVNFTQTKGATWTAMENQLQERNGTIGAKLSDSAAAQWNDSGLQSDYASWQAQAAQAKTLADAGQFYAALQMQSSLFATADNISARIDANDQAVAGLQSNLQSIDESIAALSSANANSTNVAGLSKAQAQLRASISYPIAASQLPGLENQSAQLEQLVLAQVGQMTLGLPAQSGGNVSGQAQQIVNTSGNASAGVAANASASAPSSTGNGSSGLAAQLKAAGCPLPIGLALLAGLAALLTIARPGPIE